MHRFVENQAGLRLDLATASDLDPRTVALLQVGASVVMGSSAVSLEFWATFGANGSGARVFDFGRTSSGVGQQYLYFSPHSETSSHNLQMSTARAVNLDTPGVLDGQSIHEW